MTCEFPFSLPAPVLPGPPAQAHASACVSVVHVQSDTTLLHKLRVIRALSSCMLGRGSCVQQRPAGPYHEAQSDHASLCMLCLWGPNLHDDLLSLCSYGAVRPDVNRVIAMHAAILLVMPGCASPKCAITATVLRTPPAPCTTNPVRPLRRYNPSRHYS